MKDMIVITKAIEQLLISYEPLRHATIDRSTRVNFDTSRMPWIGVYPGKRDVEPSTMGTCSRRWKSNVSPKILLQEASFSDEGTDAADKLEELLNHVIDAMSGNQNSDLRFGIDGVRLTGMNIDYTYVQADFDEEGEIFFPQAEITLTLEDR